MDREEVEGLEDAIVRAEFQDGTELRTEPAETREPLVSGFTLRYIDIPSNRTYWVVTPGDRVFEFSESNRSSNRNRAGALAALWVRAEGFEVIDDPLLIPVKIAAMGKPAMATYQKVVQDLSTESIAETLDVGKGTVEQYISKVRRGHR